MRKVKKRHMHELVAEEIQKYIEAHELGEGDKLPSVEELTRLLGVGRSSLREGLRYLEAIDIIQVENGKGIYVKNAASVGSFRYVGNVKVESEKKFLLHSLDVRRALEGKAVELAARRIDEPTIERMRECLKVYDERKRKKLDTSEVDYEFHQYIYKAASNPLLHSVFDSISELYARFFVEPLGESRLFDDTYLFHHTLFEAIAKRDVEEALGEFNKMMDMIEDNIRKY